MNKLFGFIIILFVLIIASPVQAQMMGIPTSASSQNETMQDEAEGKVVWDKLQNKEVTCTDLTADDFDVLGDFFMGNMMGFNHDSMNVLMAERLGDEGEKQMHIVMGKRLSGCDTVANFPAGSDYFTPMMGLSNYNNTSWGNSRGGMMGYGYYGMMGGGSSFGVFGWLTHLLGLVFLVLGSLFFWKGIKRNQ